MAVKLKGRYAEDRREATLPSPLIRLQITTRNQLDDCLSFLFPKLYFQATHKTLTERGLPFFGKVNTSNQRLNYGQQRTMIPWPGRAYNESDP